MGLKQKLFNKTVGNYFVVVCVTYALTRYYTTLVLSNEAVRRLNDFTLKNEAPLSSAISPQDFGKLSFYMSRIGGLYYFGENAMVIIVASLGLGYIIYKWDGQLFSQVDSSKTKA
jgi:hypothetical protein